MLLGGSNLTLDRTESFQGWRTLDLHAVKISSTVVIGFSH